MGGSPIEAIRENIRYPRGLPSNLAELKACKAVFRESRTEAIQAVAISNSLLASWSKGLFLRRPSRALKTEKSQLLGERL